jgi:large subunit ribosomal protein L10
MERAEKHQEVQLLEGKLTSSPMALCTDYRGLSVEQMTLLRRELKANGAVGRVVKNTLARLSVEQGLAQADQAEREKFAALFTGPSFLIFAGEDVVGPSKVLAKFAKEWDKLEIKGGWFEGAFVDASGVEQLSKLPSKEELYSQLLSVISAPATQVVRLLSAPAGQLVRLLGAYKDKLEAKGS